MFGSPLLATNMNKNSQQLKTPIAFIIFNRPDTTQEVFNKIKKIKPEQLFVIADGARNNEEWQECNKTRDIINQVNWNCKVHKNYSNKNLGCKVRVSSGLDWFFQNVEEGIILEDDCVPHQNFFQYCEDLLEKYRDNEKIMQISGQNLQFGKKRGNADYYFSIFNHIWGWATWRRAWQYYDVEMKTFPEFKEKMEIKKIFDKKRFQKYWNKVFQKTYSGKIDTWDYQWTYTCWLKNGLTCLPNVNLVTNIGFDERGTHTKNKESRHANIEAKKIHFPLKHPQIIKTNKKADNYTNRHVYKTRRSFSVFSGYLIRLILNKIGLFNIAKATYLKLKNR